MKKSIALLLALTLILTFAACAEKNVPETPGGSPSTLPTEKPPSNENAVTEIYYLNFKPEIAGVYARIAEAYKAETGVTLKVETAAAGTYEQTLTSEIVKTDAPVIFQINGPVGYRNWKDYCADLSGSELYGYLSDKSLAVTEGEGVYGIPYVVEAYGIIYNNAIMEKYFALENRAVTFSSMEEVNNFAALRAVVEDMTARKEELGIRGVFASTSFASGEDWRWQTHLANMPFYYAFRDISKENSTILTGLAASEVEFRYNENFKNLFDLYINNSCTEPKLLGSKTVADSMTEFALGQAAMVQNGNWAWSQIEEAAGNTVKGEDVRFLPLYTGMPGEEEQGLCIGTENYLAINSKASPEKQAAALDFLTWLFSSESGKRFVKNDLGFIAPFNTFSNEEKPEDPLAREALRWMESGKTSVEWATQSFPGQEFKSYFGQELLAYCSGTETWEDVVTAVKGAWAQEYARLAQ